MPKKRDYHNKKHPSLWDEQEEIKKEKKSFHKTILFFIFIIIIILIIYALIFSCLFQIKNVVVSGSSKVGETAEIQQVAQDFLEHRKFLVLPNSNAFILNRQSLKRLLEKKFDLEYATVGVDWPKTLEIEVQNKFPALVWQEGEIYYSVYSDGVIKNKIVNLAEYELPIINRGTTTDVMINEQVVSNEQMQYISELNSLFNYYFKDLGVRQFVLTSLESREVKLITNQGGPAESAGWYILFSLEIGVEESVNIVKSVLDQKIEDSNTLQYIDVRIKDKIYYK